MQVEFLSNDKKVLNVITLGKTGNPKISKKSEIVLQTYHFDIKQLQFIADNGKGITLKEGFIQPKLTTNNCGVCPLRFGGCYTFKFHQALGHLSKLKAIIRRNKLMEFSTLTDEIKSKVLYMLSLTSQKYIRFGTYGCPTHLPIDLVKDICNEAKTWTGYTHEWNDPNKAEYLNYFMASSHSNDSTFASEIANKYGFRTFEINSKNGVYCPHYTHGVKCSDCGLCSGTIGKGKTNIYTHKH